MGLVHGGLGFSGLRIWDVGLGVSMEVLMAKHRSEDEMRDG